MKKIIVIGCSGSGKSTFSKKLNKLLNIPLFHLDMMFWKEDKTTVERSIFNERLFEIMKLDEWIIDGNFRSTMELRIIECDTVIFLDYPLEVCLEGINERKGKIREDIPWVENDEDNKSFIEFIKNNYSDIRTHTINLLNKYSYKNIFVFKCRKEADEFLIKLLNW